MAYDSKTTRTGTSVIMPVHNGEDYIAEAIASALAQLDEADRVIVVDDASTDSTRSILAAISDHRIELCTASGRGVSSARNIGLAAAKGEFVAFLDHDDLWPESRHKVLMAALLDKPDVDAAFGCVRVRFEQGVSVTPRYLAIDGKQLHGGSLCTGLFRRRILARIDGFDENMKFGEDIDYYMRLKEQGMRFVSCDNDSLIYRRHQTNSTNDKSAVINAFSDMLQRKIARQRFRKADGGE